MARIRVKLYGALPKLVQAYDKERGLDLVLPDDAHLKAVLETLGIPEERRVVGVLDGRVIKPYDPLPDGVTLTLLESASGG